jgi:hypothetical protein
MVALQSGSVIDLLDSEKTQAVISRSALDPANKNNFLCTFRCEEDRTRLEIKIRTTEGQHGELQVFIYGKDSKICQSVSLPIKPLSLHERVLEVLFYIFIPKLSKIK